MFKALPILALAASVPVTQGCTRSSGDRAPADQALATTAQGPDNRREVGETSPAVAPSASAIYRTFAWDVTAKRETWTRFGIECPQFSASTSRLLCVRGNETLLLDAATGEELATLPVLALVVKQVEAFSPRGSYIITRSNLSEYAVREGLSGKLINTIVFPGTPRSMAVSPDETMIAIAGSGGPVYGNLSDPRVRAAVRRPVLLLALPSGERLAELQVPTSSQVDTLQFVGNGMLAAGTYDDLTMFEMRERTIARQLAAPSQMSFGSMTISPDGTTMVVTTLLSTGGTNLWDIESNSPIKALVPGKGRLHVRFANGNTLVSWGQDRTIAFLDSKTGAAERELSLPIASSARDVTWSSDLGVVAAGADGTAWVWDHDGDPVSLQDGSRRMRHAMVTGDGRSVIVTAVDDRKELEELAGELRKASEKPRNGK